MNRLNLCVRLLALLLSAVQATRVSENTFAFVKPSVRLQFFTLHKNLDNVTTADAMCAYVQVFYPQYNFFCEKARPHRLDNIVAASLNNETSLNTETLEIPAPREQRGQKQNIRCIIQEEHAQYQRALARRYPSDNTIVILLTNINSSRDLCVILGQSSVGLPAVAIVGLDAAHYRDSFFYILAHEVGHALGYSHSDSEDNIMYKFMIVRNKYKRADSTYYAHSHQNSVAKARAAKAEQPFAIDVAKIRRAWTRIRRTGNTDRRIPSEDMFTLYKPDYTRIFYNKARYPYLRLVFNRTHVVHSVFSQFVELSPTAIRNNSNLLNGLYNYKGRYEYPPDGAIVNIGHDIGIYLNREFLNYTTRGLSKKWTKKYFRSSHRHSNMIIFKTAVNFCFDKTSCYSPFLAAIYGLIPHVDKNLIGKVEYYFL